MRQSRSSILKEARAQAQEILDTANARIERTIHEIKKAQAEKEQTKQIRSELEQYKRQVQDNKGDNILPGIARLNKRTKQQSQSTRSPQETLDSKKELAAGDYVKMHDGGVVGQIISVTGGKAEVAFGTLRTVVALSKLKPAAKPKPSAAQQSLSVSQSTSNDSRTRQLNFKQEIDLRGMRADEALQAVTYFIDDAVQFEIPRVRILHGTGTGALREAVRQWLGASTVVKSYHDEDVRFGGAGITVVEL